MPEPTFSRIEIMLENRADLETARREILDLAADLRQIGKDNTSDEAALILARHRIKRTSQKLRRTV